MRYRLNNLRSSGVLRSCYTAINAAKFGQYYYKIFFKFFNINEVILEMVIKALCSHDSIHWVIRTEGKYDLGANFRVSNPLELSDKLDQIKRRYSAHISQLNYSVVLQLDLLERSYLAEAAKSKRKEPAVIRARDQLFQADEINKQILFRLAQDSRITAVEIGRQLSLSADAVLSRIRRLEREKVIVKYGAFIDSSKLGLQNFYVLIYLSSFSPMREKGFVETCRKNSRIVTIVKALGEWDYELSLEVASVDEYRRIMMDLTREFSDIIRDYAGLIVTETRKFELV